MSDFHSVNAEQRLYTLKCSGGFTCLGFDVADDRAREAAKTLNRPELIPMAEKGTREHYEQYCVAYHALAESNPGTTHFDHRTSDIVRSILESVRTRGTRVRIFNGDVETGEAWAEECDVIGTISRSMGPIKIPILIANSRSQGGGGLLDGSIVAIMDRPGHFLYRHPTFNVGKWTVGEPDAEGYVSAAYHDGKLHARFKKPGQAERYVAFMKGERFAK